MNSERKGVKVRSSLTRSPGDASGRKHDDITWPERHNQTRLIQAQLAVFKVPYGDDYTEPLILAVPVPQCRGIEINDH